jgi:hypothetical protein
MVAFQGGGQPLQGAGGGEVLMPIVAATGNNGAAWSPSGEIVLGSEGNRSRLDARF